MEARSDGKVIIGNSNRIIYRSYNYLRKIEVFKYKTQKGKEEMKKYKCDECEELHDKTHVTIECSKCYAKGFDKERQKICDAINKMIFLSHKNRKTIIKKIKRGEYY